MLKYRSVTRAGQLGHEPQAVTMGEGARMVRKVGSAWAYPRAGRAPAVHMGARFLLLASFPLSLLNSQ